MVQEEQEHHQSNQSIASSSQDEPVGWMNQETEREYYSSTRSSEYMVMVINVSKLKIPNARVLANVCGKSIWLWVDNGSSVTTFSLPELKRAMGRARIRLHPVKDEFLD